MVASSRRSTATPSSDHAESTWQVVNVEKFDPTGKKQYATTAPLPSVRHHQGHTERNRRLSMFRMRSRSNTTLNTSMDHCLSPSASFDSRDSHRDNAEECHPESGWSDSEHSDSMTKSWVARGSRMLRKQNSKFNLSTSRRSTWVEESDEAGEQYPESRLRGHNKHGRMWSTGSGYPVRLSISKPYNFQHLTHTQAHHFTDLHSTSQHRLKSAFSAIRASQAPQRELQGIPTEDLRFPVQGTSPLVYRHPVTPPSLSPTKYRTSRCNSSLSTNTPGTLSRSRSIDNFSQPSPRTYRLPHSPTSPPARTSSRNATHPAPDFFSDVHHATPKERELLSRCNAPVDVSGFGPFLSGVGNPRQLDHAFDNGSLPHAITTSDDIALTLKPTMARRSTLALADVPEEDELRSMKWISNETFRTVTADPALRHATSFPSNDCSPRRKCISSSLKSLRLSGVMPVDRDTFRDSVVVDMPIPCTMSKHLSTNANGVDACWEDDIDYCYEHEAEADCDFEWDRVSMDNTLIMDCSRNLKPLINTHRESAESLSKTYEKLESPREDEDPVNTSVSTKVGSHHLPRLETSLPDLDFSATSSAKSSTASLHGPITPLQPLPSTKKVRPAIHSSKSTDTLNLDSSFFASHDCDLPWTQEHSLQMPSLWDHANDFNYPFNNLSLSGSSTRTSLRSNRPALSTHHSSDNVLRSASSPTVQTRRSTSSSGSFPELICSQNYRQQANVVAEQIANRISALSVSDVYNAAASSQPHPFPTRNAPLHSILKKGSTSSSHSSLNGRQETEVHPGPQDSCVSVGSFASKLRSNSTASSVADSSSVQASRVSYSLFPTLPLARA